MEKNNQPLIITAIIGGIVLIIALAFIFTRNNDSEPKTNNQTDTTETESENNGSENGVNEGGENGNNQQSTPDPQVTPEPENPGDAIRLMTSSFQPSDGGLTTSTTASITVWSFRTEPLQITCTYSALLTHDVAVIEGNSYVAQPGNNEFSEILSGVDANANNLTVKCEPNASVLPSTNWNSLTAQEKTDLNPFDCDHKTQWISAEDGTCIEKTATIWNLLDPRLPDDVLLDELTMCPDNQDDCFGGIVLAVQNKDPWRLQAYIEWYRKEGELLNWTLTIFAYNGSEQLADYADDTKLIHHNYSDPLPADCPLGWIEIPDGCIIEN